MDWIYLGHASQFCTRLLPRCLGAQTKHKSVEIRKLALGEQRNSGEWVGGWVGGSKTVFGNQPGSWRSIFPGWRRACAKREPLGDMVGERASSRLLIHTNWSSA